MAIHSGVSPCHTHPWLQGWALLRLQEPAMLTEPRDKEVEGELTSFAYLKSCHLEVGRVLFQLVVRIGHNNRFKLWIGRY